MSSTTVALSDLIAALGGDLLGGSELRIAAIAPLDEADEHGISFLANPRYQAQLATTRAGRGSAASWPYGARRARTTATRTA